MIDDLDRAAIKFGAGNLMSRRSMLVGSGVAALGLTMPGIALAQAGGAGAAVKRPRFANGVADWKFTVPPGKEAGNISAVAVSPVTQDVFFLQTPVQTTNDVPEERRLPFIVRTDKNGKFINAFGGPSFSPTIDGDNQWMGTPDNLEVDAEGNVWVSPDLRTRADNATLCFSPDGKFLKQFGVRKNPSSGPGDKTFFNHPSSVHLDRRTNTWFIADGYGKNHRIVTVDGRTGKMTRIWGAYGKDPAYFEYEAKRGYMNLSGATPSSAVGVTIDPPKNDGFGIPIHRVILAPDGKLLAADRANNRVQEFEILPDGVRYIRQVYVAPGTDSYGSASDIAVTPDNKWLYVSSMRDNRIYIVDRATFQVLSWVSVYPDEEGTDALPVNLRPFHRFALLPNGDILCARCVRGLAVKKFVGVY